MGSVVSAIASGIDGVLSTIAKGVADAGATVAHLQSISQDMAAGPPPSQQSGDALRSSARRGMYLSPPVLLFAKSAAVASGDDVQAALKAAMDAAKAAAAKLFNAEFNQAPTGTDNGVVSGYSSSGSDLSSVIQQMKSDFSNWDLPLSDDQISKMASTLQTQVQAQMGRAGTSWGRYILNVNQSALWTVSYGLFQITQSSQGLVYGFSGAMDGGFSS